MNKPHSAACDNNRQPILSIIELLFANCKAVLEIGSGTGQHAVYFAGNLPHMVWHTSDLPENHAGIELWLNEAALPNTPSPLTLNVTQANWPRLEVDAVFSANAAHIMGWEAVKAMIAGVGKLLPDRGLLVLYGPFNYNNTYTSDSNARFDIWLKDRDPESGIRNYEDVEQLANAAGMYLQNDYAMPANNRILCWMKQNVN
jgi:cyclopropane fatty-acyl-phospholipid synthase-like methyltransferase